MEISQKDSEKERKISFLQRFFIICSGADKGIIEQCPTDWNKFAGIGATIFLTAVLASLSGGYAIHTTFESSSVAVAFALLWGAVIFNLDRYIVLSMKKEDTPTKEYIEEQVDVDIKRALQTKRKRQQWNAFYMALPRIIISLIIAFAISKPIELRLFKGRIDKQLVDTQKYEENRFDSEEKEQVANLQLQLDSINKQETDAIERVFSSHILWSETKERNRNLNDDIRAKEGQIRTNEDIIQKNRYRVTKYRDRTDPQTGETITEPYTTWQDNDIARAKRLENTRLGKQIVDLTETLKEQTEALDKIESSLADRAKDIPKEYEISKENIQLQLEVLRNTYSDRRLIWISANKQNIDLLAQLEALESISQFSFNPKSDNFLGNTVWWASLIIMLLFIALETAPVVVKLLTARGPYDEMLDRVEYENKIEQNELKRQIKEVRKHKTDTELETNRIVQDRYAVRQRELYLQGIEKWKAEQEAKITSNNVTT